jgi:drug/metabolite transporter (DMT)-like permease
VAAVPEDQGAAAVIALVALLAFAANSILTRLALGGGLLDAPTFTAVRLVSGAAMLGMLAGRRLKGAAGGWVSGLVLFAYAAPFSFAYLRIGAGVGALILFGAVQLTMIAWGLLKGERPGPLLWLGFALAVGGLAGLTLPGASRPDLAGAALMALAGVAWGVYSLRGRSAPDPVAANARNFLWAAPWAVLAAVALARLETVTAKGLLLAAVSGAVTSGLGYAVWYRALRGLGAVKAAVVQLPVPVLTALGAVLFLGEPVTGRLAGAGAAVLAGVALVLASRTRDVSRSS